MGSKLEPKNNIQEEVTVKRKGHLPKIIYLLLGNKMCETMYESGLKSLLTLYLKNMLEISDRSVAVALHSYYFIKAFTIVLGGALVDSYFGKFKAIIWGSVFNIFSLTLLTLSSAIEKSLPERTILVLAMLMNFVGLGGLLPSVVPFAADQLPPNYTEEDLRLFFILYFTTIQVTHIVSTLVFPALKEIECGRTHECYPLAFGIPAVFAIIALVLFASGTKFYVKKEPTSPVVIEAVKCIFLALKMKIKLRKKEKREHWIEFADCEYSKEFIADTKQIMAVLFMPIPIFWTLYDQQATTWTLQASRLRYYSTHIMPGQVHFLHPLMLLLLIPVFHYGIYPKLDRFGILRTPLQRMVLGATLISISFICSAILEFNVRKTYPEYPESGEGQLRIYNGVNCSLDMNGPEWMGEKYLGSFSFTEFIHIPVNGKASQKLELVCPEHSFNWKGNVKLVEEESVSYFNIVNNNTMQLVQLGGYDQTRSKDRGKPKYRIICAESCEKTKIRISNNEGWIWSADRLDTYTPFTESLSPGRYSVYVNGHLLDTTTLYMNGMYTIMTYYYDGRPGVRVFTTIRPNTVCAVWIIPQYFILTVSTILFYLSTFVFLYAETPKGMKALSWSMVHMNVGVGNLIAAILATPENPGVQFLLFAAVMLFGVGILVYSAHNYEYKNLSVHK